MVTLEWDLDRTDGVTFVQVHVTAQRARRVRVENRLDGPVWPPRRRGQPAAGWEDGGFEGIAAPDEGLVAGYATPAPPNEPPVELVVEDPVDDSEGADAAANATDRDAPVPTVGSTPDDVVRTLGDPVVPRDAVPLADPDEATDSGANETTGARGRERSERTGHPDPARTRDPESEAVGQLVVPGAVRAWLADVEQRVAAVERRDGVDRESALGPSVTAHRRALDRVAERVGTLAERVDALDRTPGGTRRR